MRQVVYFKLGGRGEAIRLALNAAGVEYIDTAEDEDGLDFDATKVQERPGPEFNCQQRTVAMKMIDARHRQN